MRFGLDVLMDDPASLAGRRLGLLVNAASVTRDLTPAVEAVRRSNLRLVRIFGPEHGVTGAAQDMEAVGAEPGRPEAVETVSLYGGSFGDLSPKSEHLDGLDTVICDLPDVGSRYYTFVWTTALTMKACAARGIPVVVLDRPNPLGGTIVEGNLPDDERLLSFVGLHPVPVRHGMTPGEIATWANEERQLGCDLRVVTMGETDGDVSGRGLPWVLPSPNMPSRETALVYPGGCLVEGTNLSEGRGTTRPFEMVGAPWLDAAAAASAANALELSGVRFRAHSFKPTFQKHAGRACGGVQVHVTDEGAFRPYETYLRLLQALRSLDPASFAWRTDSYEYRDDVPAIDLLTGTPTYRRLVDAGRSLDEWIGTFAGDVATFEKTRRKHLLYRRSPVRPAVVHLVGAHESGKTTLLVALIGKLTAEGLRVGSIKHTDHEYETDLPGKDSTRHAAAGANPAVLAAGRRTATHRAGVSGARLDEILTREMAGLDLVLVEGFKREPGLKIEVVRAATGREPVAAGEGLLAVVTDRETSHPSGVPRLGFADLDGLSALVKRAAGLS